MQKQAVVILASEKVIYDIDDHYRGTVLSQTAKKYNSFSVSVNSCHKHSNCSLCKSTGTELEGRLSMLGGTKYLEVIVLINWLQY